ncbi:MAG TPA: YvrJ family protein [Clostridiales bacterium]|nr:YvrJ family protein [Clostridiales bacterium]
MIADIGFPIVISVYLLVRIEKKMESLTVSIQSLTNAINKMK